MPIIKRQPKPGGSTAPISEVPGPSLRRVTREIRVRLARELGCEPLLRATGGYRWLEEADLGRSVLADLTRELPRELWAQLIAADDFDEDEESTVSLFEHYDHASLRIIVDDETGPFVQVSLGGQDLERRMSAGFFFWDGRWNAIVEQWLREHPDSISQVP